MKSSAKSQREKSTPVAKEVELSVLRQRVTDLCVSHPDKAATILSAWINSGPQIIKKPIQKSIKTIKSPLRRVK